MVSETPTKLPTINLSGENLIQGTRSWTSTCNNVRQALEDYGCFVAVYDKFTLDLHNNVVNVVQPMFDLPAEVKVRNSSDLPYHGYYKPGELMPLLESLGIEDPPRCDNIRSFTNLLWPNGNDKFCSETIHEYATKVTELEQMVMKMVFESYGVEKYLESHLNSTSYLLRIAKYRVPEKDENNLGAVGHTDKNFITILHQNQVNGLEVQTKDGQWLTFDFSPHSFVVMAGEPFLAWSNNRIHAPLHRVIMKGDKARYSFAMFSTTKDTIQTPIELVDEDHPLQFKPFDYMGLLQFYTEDVTRMAVCTIKDYCGV
ncbi:putative 2-oxoglutarate-dependent dioxygenase AOP1.2 [Bienertia sinuspersici]